MVRKQNRPILDVLTMYQLVPKMKLTNKINNRDVSTGTSMRLTSLGRRSNGLADVFDHFNNCSIKNENRS